MTESILVTGATGNLGGAVLQTLQAQGVACRAALRALRDTHDNSGDSVSWVALDFTRPETFAAALKGVKSIFLMRPPAIAKVKTTIHPFLDLAAEMGVEHVVFVSVEGAKDNSMVPHHGIEKHLIHGPIPYTILRPGFFSQNLGGPYLRDIRDDDRIILPAKAAKAAFIDARDIADVACRALVSPQEHKGREYTLTGQELLSFEQVAAILTDVLGRTITYQPIGALRYIWHLRKKHQLPWMQILVQTILHISLGRGNSAYIDVTLPDLLGKPARTMRDYVEDHAGLWRR